jgi:hyperosmotically inducible protein
LKRIVIALILSSALLGQGTVAMAQDSAPAAPDNSGVNVRDRAPGVVTAGQQSDAKSDVEIASEIRSAVVEDHSLSTLHNVKIVSANGSVTLRGPVKTEEEKAAIASKAQAIAGAGKVDDQLEVKGQ